MVPSACHAAACVAGSGSAAHSSSVAAAAAPPTYEKKVAIGGVAPAVIDQRGCGRIPEGAQRLDEPRPFVPRRIAHPRQQRRHRQRVANLPKGIEGRRPHLLVLVVQERQQVARRLAIAQQPEGQRRLGAAPPSPRAEVAAPRPRQLQVPGQRLGARRLRTAHDAQRREQQLAGNVAMAGGERPRQVIEPAVVVGQGRGYDGAIVIEQPAVPSHRAGARETLADQHEEQHHQHGAAGHEERHERVAKPLGDRQQHRATGSAARCAPRVRRD
jgi:hypothetical protein